MDSLEAAMRRDPRTFTQDPPDFDSYILWRSHFPLESIKQKTSTMFYGSPELQAQHSILVPDKATSDDFWCRYFYKLNRLHENEQLQEVRPQAVTGTVGGTGSLDGRSLTPRTLNKTYEEAQQEIKGFMHQVEHGAEPSDPFLESSNLPDITPRTMEAADESTLAFIRSIEGEASAKEAAALELIQEDALSDTESLSPLSSNSGSMLGIEPQVPARQPPLMMPRLRLQDLNEEEVLERLNGPVVQDPLSPEASSKQAAIITSRRGRVEALTNSTMQLEETYSQPPSDTAAFEAWLYGFPIDQVVSKTDCLLEQHPELHPLHSKLVPTECSNEDFWSRYFFALKRMHEVEQALESQHGGGRRGSDPAAAQAQQSTPTQLPPSRVVSVGTPNDFYEDEADIYEL